MDLYLLEELRAQFLHKFFIFNTGHKVQLTSLEDNYAVFRDVDSGQYSVHEHPGQYTFLHEKLYNALAPVDFNAISDFILVHDKSSKYFVYDIKHKHFHSLPDISSLRSNTRVQKLRLQDFYMYSDDTLLKYYFVKDSQGACYVVSSDHSYLDLLTGFNLSGCTLFLDLHGLNSTDDIAIPSKLFLPYMINAQEIIYCQEAQEN